MGRKSKGPWYWKQRDTYVVNVRGKRHLLGPDKEADRKWHELAAKPEEAMASLDSVWAVLESFLADAKVNTAPRTYEFYRYRLQQFKDALPNMPVNWLRPHHVRDWLNTKPEWSSTYKAGVIASLKRAFNWAVNDKRIDRNPLRALKSKICNFPADQSMCLKHVANRPKSDSPHLKKRLSKLLASAPTDGKHAVRPLLSAPIDVALQVRVDRPLLPRTRIL